MSRIGKLLKPLCLSLALCIAHTPVMAAQSDNNVVQPDAAYTTTVSVNTGFVIAGDSHTLHTTFRVTADDTTGIINQVTFKSWSISPSITGLAITSGCDLLSISKVNNYRYKAEFLVYIMHSATYDILSSSNVTVYINSPGARSIN